MGDYKQRNKELIDENRELKQIIATYQKELVLTRAELMEQHRIRVEREREYRDRVLALLAQNFMASVHDINANVNIPELLGTTHLVREFCRSRG